MFSIVVPVYNKRDLLPATLRSALAQSFADFELILVDDGSTDGSLEAVAGLSDPRLRTLRQANAGPGAARNAGIEAARHDWVAFLDADDLWLPDHLAELDRIRGLHPEAGLIGTAFALGNRAGPFAAPPADAGRIDGVDYFDRVGRGASPFWISSAAVRREVYEALGGFNDDPIGQDSEYWARIAFDYPVAASSRVTAVYVLGTGGIIDRARDRWRGRPPRSAAELSTAVALVLERHAGVESPVLRATLDRYVDRYVHWRLREAIAVGDVATVRALRAFYRAPPPREDRLLLSVARLPAPLARAAYRAGLGLKAALRRLGLIRI